MPAQLSNIALIVGIIAIFYLLVIRPQQKRVKDQQDLASSLAAGDEIMTFAGVFARVVEVGERLLVETCDGSRMEIAPGAVSKKVASASEEASGSQSAAAEAENVNEEGDR